MSEEKRMWIDQGEIISPDISVKERLKQWQKEVDIPDGTPIRIMTDEHYQRLIDYKRIAHIA